MAKIKVGDKVRIKERPDWPSPPGYKLANSEGRVTQVGESDGLVEGIGKEFVIVQLEKTGADFDIGTHLTFQSEAVEKI